MMVRIKYYLSSLIEYTPGISKEESNVDMGKVSMSGLQPDWIGFYVNMYSSSDRERATMLLIRASHTKELVLRELPTSSNDEKDVGYIK